MESHFQDKTVPVAVCEGEGTASVVSAVQITDGDVELWGLCPVCFRDQPLRDDATVTRHQRQDYEAMSAGLVRCRWCGELYRFDGDSRGCAECVGRKMP